MNRSTYLFKIVVHKDGVTTRTCLEMSCNSVQYAFDEFCHSFDSEIRKLTSYNLYNNNCKMYFQGKIFNI